MWNIKEDILKNVGVQTVSGPTDLKKPQWKSMGTEAVWLPTFFKTSCTVFQRRKKGLEGHEFE